MVARLSFRDAPAEFRAAALALRAVERPIRRAVAQDMRATMGPVWAATLAEHATGDPRDAILAAGARIAAGNPPELVTASTRRRYGHGGGLIPVEHWPGFEYGAGPHHRPVTYSRTRRGARTHTVTRDVLTGHPARTRRGRVIAPTVAAVLPRIAAYWVASVIRCILDAAETRN